MTALLALVMAVTLTAVPVSELDADPDAWSGQEVTVTGEIVGDYSLRDEVVWFQLNDDAYTSTPLAERAEPAGTNTGIGVRISREAWSDEWGSPGRYGQRGPIVEVTGIFRHNSPDDQGETFVEGARVRLVDPARPIETEPASPTAAIAGALLGLVGILLYRRGTRPQYRTGL